MKRIFVYSNETPDVVAIAGMKLEFSYSTFKDTVQRFAAKLRASGVKPGHVVGLKLRPELQSIALAAVMHEGAVSFAATRSILDGYSRDIDFVVTEDTSWVGGFTRVISVDAEWLQSLGAVNSQIEPIPFDSEDSLALLVFSSGTTGTPKGVQFSVRDIYRRTQAAASNWMPSHPFFAELGLDTVSGMQTYFWSLLEGKTYFLSTTAEENAALIQKFGIQSIKTSPAKLADLALAVSQMPGALGTLREVQVAGGLLAPVVSASLRAVSNANLTYLYGSTEAGTVTRGTYDPQEPECVGQIVDGAEVEILDDEGRTIPVGQVGTIRIRTPYQTSGYWKNEKADQTGFHDGWFLPGDTGYLDGNNFLRVAGRSDELINANGIKVNPAVIDAKLNGYRGLKDLAAFGFIENGQITKSLALAIVSENDVGIDQLQDHLAGLFPELGRIVVIRVPEIPRNALGKPQRNKLASLLENR